MKYTYKVLCSYTFSFFHQFKVNEKITVDYEINTEEGKKRFYKDLSNKVHAMPSTLEIFEITLIS